MLPAKRENKSITAGGGEGGGVKHLELEGGL